MFVYKRLFFCLFQESLDVMSTNDENTLGSTLELYSRYMEAARVRKHVFTLPLILRTQGKGGGGGGLEDDLLQ